MFTAGIIRNENIALSHMIWTKVWSVCSVQSGNWEQLTTGPELASGLHPATATPGLQALDALRIFGQLIVLSLSACLLYDFFWKGEAELGSQCQKNGKRPFIPERTVSGNSREMVGQAQINLSTELPWEKKRVSVI